MELNHLVLEFESSKVLEMSMRISQILTKSLQVFL